MLAPYEFPAVTVNESRLEAGGAGLSRLFAAAVVNAQFRDQLLNHPGAALAGGYFGESFLLTEREESLILSHHASTLPDLARHITKALR